MSSLVRLPASSYAIDALGQFKPGGFSFGAARAACWLSQLAYEIDHTKIELILERWGLRHIGYLYRPVTTLLPLSVIRGFAAAGFDTIFLVFAGTDPISTADWAVDFNIM